jgi:hypothetical protein
MPLVFIRGCVRAYADTYSLERKRLHGMKKHMNVGLYSLTVIA